MKTENKAPVKRVHSLVYESIEKDTLAHCYIDKFGNNYYEFPNLENMSVIRYTSATEAVKYCEMNLTYETYLRFIESIKQALNQRPQDSAKIGSIVFEMENRAKFAGEKLTLLNLACVYFIREDENPIVFDSKVQIEKQKSWEEDDDAMAFFLQRAWELTNNYRKFLDIDIMNYLKEMEMKGVNPSNPFRK